jgi:hypothetical protein
MYITNQILAFRSTDLWLGLFQLFEKDEMDFIFMSDYTIHVTGLREKIHWPRNKHNMGL